MPRRAATRTNPAENQEAQVPEVPAWISEAVSKNVPFDERVRLLRNNLLQGERVPSHQVLQLFPRELNNLLTIEATLPTDTPWLMAALRYYRDPWEAFKKLSECAARGLECSASSGREFYGTHQRWVADRGDLGLLNAGSMGLFFRERRILSETRPSRQE